jgi:hypothetical protein
MIIKELKIGSTGITLTIGERIVELVRSNIFYCFQIRAVRRYLLGLKDIS